MTPLILMGLYPLAMGLYPWGLRAGEPTEPIPFRCTTILGLGEALKLVICRPSPSPPSPPS
eukprot:CAMPEP_0173363544 /NCGR_PEP_ID=MMETSP1144-20121109/22453_1 /TAXON_ID=483371 /ORGANISM="non described non described, Strain CCMP2298" /LENGTH=60 /DNA_ID=CAMNT_0014313523 /DNA_START=77 /DNA_END=255 /DNA_ORIENTATION=-